MRNVLRTVRVSSYIKPEMRLTPPRRAKRRIAGLVTPTMASRVGLLWRLAPPLPPLPRPDMIECVICVVSKNIENCLSKVPGEGPKMGEK